MKYNTIQFPPAIGDWSSMIYIKNSHDCHDCHGHDRRYEATSKKNTQDFCQTCSYNARFIYIRPFAM